MAYLCLALPSYLNIGSFLIGTVGTSTENKLELRKTGPPEDLFVKVKLAAGMDCTISFICRPQRLISYCSTRNLTY